MEKPNIFLFVSFFSSPPKDVVLTCRHNYLYLCQQTIIVLLIEYLRLQEVIKWFRVIHFIECTKQSQFLLQSENDKAIATRKIKLLGDKVSM